MFTLLILNFAHPLASEVKEQLLAMHKGECEVAEHRFFVHLNFHRPLEPQVSKIMDEVTPLINGNTSLVVVLPGLPIAGALVLAELRGRTGFFPRVLHLWRDPMTQLYKLRCVVDLEGVRETARDRRRLLARSSEN